MQFPSESLISFTVMSLWVYALRVRKTTCNPHCIFGTSNYKLWWMFSDLQFLGDLATDDDSSWATDTRTTMKQRDAREERNDLERRLMSWTQMNILMLLLFCCVSGWYGGLGMIPGLIWKRSCINIYGTTGYYFRQNQHKRIHKSPLQIFYLNKWRNF